MFREVATLAHHLIESSKTAVCKQAVRWIVPLKVPRLLERRPCLAVLLCVHNVADCCRCCCTAVISIYEYASTERCAPNALLLVSRPEPTPADCSLATERCADRASGAKQRRYTAAAIQLIDRSAAVLLSWITSARHRNAKTMKKRKTEISERKIIRIPSDVIVFRQLNGTHCAGKKNSRTADLLSASCAARPSRDHLATDSVPKDFLPLCLRGPRPAPCVKPGAHRGPRSPDRQC